MTGRLSGDAIDIDTLCRVPTRVEFADTLHRPWYLGIALGTLAYGIISAQTWTFYMAARDGAHTRFDRWIVALINVFQCVQSLRHKR